MSDKEKIKEEIKRLKQTNGYLPVDNHEICDTYRARGYQFACDDILQFIDTLPEEPTVKGITWEDINTLESLIYQVHNEYPSIGEKSFGLEVLERFQDCQDVIEEPVSENLEEYYKKEFLPNEWFAKPGQRTISQFNFFTAKHFAEWQKQKDFEELLKSDMSQFKECYEKGKADAMKEMKEALQTEYEKGRSDMMEKMMKALIEGEVVKDMHNQLSVKSEPLNNTFGDIKFGEKVKIIIVKPE